jgi:hypothetical protein
MSGNILPYTNLITSEHADKPNFMDMVAAICQPFADTVQVLQNTIPLFDLDSAVGDQLDKVGQWIGPTRNIDVAIAGVYFAFDTVGLGFDQGVWLGPYDSATGITVLPDDHYRVLLKAQVLNNRWDGTLQSAYTIGNLELSIFGHTLQIIDNQNMTMNLHILGSGVVDALTLALLNNGYFNIRPMGVTSTII